MKDFNTNTENNDTWLTPPWILNSLGSFDLDPCSPMVRPFDTAKEYYTIEDDGLIMPWHGRVWLNPPYGRGLKDWMNKMALHGNGISLVFARTDTIAFQHYVFPFATSILFMRRRVAFCDINGHQMNTANAPSVLLSYGDLNADSLEQSGIEGAHIQLKPQILIVGLSREKTWRVVVGDALRELNRKSTLNEIYDAVMEMAPDKVGRNQHFKAKIRQILQYFYNRVDKGTYIN